jgi:hypothetical protein
MKDVRFEIKEESPGQSFEEKNPSSAKKASQWKSLFKKKTMLDKFQREYSQGKYYRKKELQIYF